MKKLIILLFIIINYVNAQDRDPIILFNPAYDFDLASQPDPINNSQIPEIPDDDPYRNMYRYSQGNTPVIYDNHILILRIYDRTSNELTKLGSFDEVSVELFQAKEGTSEESIKLNKDVDGTILKKYIPADRELGMTDFNIYLDGILSANQMEHLDDLFFKISIKKTDENISIIEYYKAKYFISDWSNYNSFGANTSGFWLPSLLFSSNLKETETGIPFASLPIGIAYGKKYNTKNQRYVGLSVMANWLIYTEPENSSIESSNSFNLQGATLGILVDFNDVISVGIANGFNFKKGENDPGLMFVLGFGAEAIGFLKKDKKN